jgi:hypothetical protein
MKYRVIGNFFAPFALFRGKSTAVFRFNIEHRTSNIEHPTLNCQLSKSSHPVVHASGEFLKGVTPPDDQDQLSDHQKTRKDL